MDIVLIILAIIAGIVGIIGSVLPVLPGPPVSWVGLLLIYFHHGTDKAGDSMSLTFLLIWLAVVIIVSVIDYLVPIYFTKITGGSKYASHGALAGMIVGIFLSPLGMIIGSFLGAFLMELVYAEKSTSSALKSALGSFLGFLTGTGLKLITTCMMLYYIIVYI